MVEDQRLVATRVVDCELMDQSATNQVHATVADVADKYLVFEEQGYIEGDHHAGAAARKGEDLLGCACEGLFDDVQDSLTQLGCGIPLETQEDVGVSLHVGANRVQRDTNPSTAIWTTTRCIGHGQESLVWQDQDLIEVYGSGGVSRGVDR